MSDRRTKVRGRRAAAHGAVLGALLLVAACDGGPTNPEGRGGSAGLALAITLQAEAGGGEGDAFDAADAIHILVTGSAGGVLFDQTAAFEPAAETRVPVAVRIEETTQARLDVILLRGTSPLFRGTTPLTLEPNDVAPAELTLVPVAASISVPETLPALHSLGETAELPGSVLFATGDVASSLHVTWTSLTPGVVTVQTNGTTSSVVAVASGHGVLAAAFPPFVQDVQIDVDIVPATVTIDPATAAVPLGETLQLTAVVQDALGNPLPSTPLAWSSLNEDIASVTADGLVLGLADGTTTIRAVAGAVTGEATIEVVAPPPSVGTEPASGVRVYGATLNATVSAAGSPATAWFRYGTDPTLATADETPHVDIGSGKEEQSFSLDVDGLDPATAYHFRAVASNDGGEVEGEIATFTTLAEAPPVVATLGPVEVESTQATLAATVDPRGAATTAWFEWGLDVNLNTYTETEHMALGAGVDPEDFQQTIMDLTPEGTVFYYYRVVAENPTGTTRGSIVSFKTAPSPPTGLGGGFDGPTLFLYWTDNSSSETSFRVERSASETEGFSRAASAPSDYPYAEDDGPFPAGILYYRVRACNGSLCSEPSNVLTVAVPPPTITGYTYVCYGGTDCSGYGPFTVTLLGSIATSSGAGGFYSFPPIPTGTYTVHVDGAGCYYFPTNERSVTLEWGEVATLDFYGEYDYDSCAALEAAVGPPGAPGALGALGARPGVGLLLAPSRGSASTVRASPR